MIYQALAIKAAPALLIVAAMVMGLAISFVPGGDQPSTSKRSRFRPQW